MTSYEMDNNRSLPSKHTTVFSSSAPTFALLSEKGESLDIDVNTGLPKLPIELPESFIDYNKIMEKPVPRRASYNPGAEVATQQHTNPSTRKQVSVWVGVCGGG